MHTNVQFCCKPVRTTTKTKKNGGMADNADSPVQRSRISKDTSLHNLLTAGKGHCGLICAVCAFVAATALFTAIVAVGVYISKCPVPTTSTSTPFCCPEEAEEMSRHVNASVEPCNDFSAYVCANRTHGSSELGRGQWVRIVVTGMLPEGAQKSNAWLFLNAYHKSCVETVSRRGLFFSDLASGVVDAMRQLLSKPDTRNAMAYGLRMSVTYKLPALFEAHVFGLSSFALFPQNSWCEPNSLSHLALEASASALRNILNMTVTEGRATEIMDSLCTRFSNDFFDFRNYTFDDHSLNNVWSINDVKAGWEIFGYPATNATKLAIFGVSAIRAIYDVFSATAKTIADGQKAVLLVWKSVESGQTQFNIAPTANSLNVFRSCEKSLDYMGGLKDLSIIQLFEHVDVEVKVTAIFPAIRNTVYEDCRSSSLFQPEDHSRLETLFRSISLLTPSEIVKSSTEIPQPGSSFAANLLQGRAYTFAVLQKGIADFASPAITYKSVRYFRGPQLFHFPPEAYTRSVAGTSFRSELVSMTVLGRLMAESLWYVVLSDDAWGGKTKDNIKRFVDCLVSNYNIHRGHLPVSVDDAVDASSALAADALGLASVVRALSRPGWRTSKHAWSLWYLSHGQLFHMLTTLHRCPEKWSSRRVRITNVPLKQLEDFARTFRCPPEAPMNPKNRCTWSAARKLDQ
ncbi:hypothetical protein HPB48_018810 [Haemaphysalis longicornis]|uniref:Uncharacterized protein n=1 Tax=Haemaphysalis longicornis TaxID=44386 RepID=A0A9J6GC64_HAELO|nr:hypothetical protein HPB48_018810 [Haemaphysalis longicornis]